MESGGKTKSGAKENGGERKAMEYWGEMMEDWDVTMPVLASEMPVLASEMVMCSTCSSFVRRKKRKAFPDPGEEVVEVVMEAEKMRNLSEAFLRYGPFQEMEPAAATKKQRQVLRRRRRIMMETKKCPACSRSLLCSTCSRSMSEKHTGAGPDEEDKAAGSKEKKSSSEEGSELMAVANARSVKKSKRSRVEGNGSSSGLKKKNEDKEGSRSKKKASISSDMEGSGLKKVETEGSGSTLATMEVRESAGENGKNTKLVTWKKTKMVTRRLDRMSIDIILRTDPRKPYMCDTINPMLEIMFASDIREYEVDREFHEYLHRQSSIRGYAEYQMEVTDDEDE